MSQKKREVFEACDSLLKKGKKLSEITINALATELLELGYVRGGNTPLTRYRKEWMETQGFRDEDKNKNIMGVKETSDVVYHATERLRQSVVEDVRKEYEEKFQALLEQQEAMREENLTLQGTLLDLTDENMELKNKLTTATEDLSIQKQDLESTQTALIDLKARFEMQSQTMATQEEHWQRKYNDMRNTCESQIESIHGELEKQRANQQQALEMLKDNYENQHHQWIKEKDDFKTEIQKLQKIVETTKEQLITVKAQLQQKTAHSEKIETQNQTLLHNIDAFQAHCQAHMENITTLKTENNQRQENLEVLQRTYQDTVADLQKEISALHEDICLNKLHARDNDT
ncbi:MAG: DNA-binding protein [Gammaproteobacteria bacterium]